MIGKHKAADFIGTGYKGRFPGQRHLDRGGSPWYKAYGLSFSHALQCFVYLRGFDIISLDNVEDGNVARGRVARIGADHDIVGLAEAAHDVENGGFSNDGGGGGGLIGGRESASVRGGNGGLVIVGNGEGCVSRHEKVASGCGDEGGEESDEIVVHVSGIAKGGGGSGHDGGHQTVELIDRRIFDFEAIHRNSIQGRVVQDHHRVGIQGESLERQDRIVRLHHHIALTLIPIGKHRIGLHQLFGKMIIERLEQVTPHARARPPRNGMTQDKALQ